MAASGREDFLGLGERRRLVEISCWLSAVRRQNDELETETAVGWELSADLWLVAVIGKGRHQVGAPQAIEQGAWQQRRFDRCDLVVACDPNPLLASPVATTRVRGPLPFCTSSAAFLLSFRREFVGR
jgi:hypothetical protein